jgi:hypothetical protein
MRVADGRSDEGREQRLDSHFLEPACDSGNLLIRALQRKLVATECSYGKNLTSKSRTAHPVRARSSAASSASTAWWWRSASSLRTITAHVQRTGPRQYK